MALETGFWIIFGTLVGLITIILLKYTGGWDVFVQVLETIRKGFDWFLSTAPKAVVVVVFLFLILTVFNVLFAGYLNLAYACTSAEELRTPHLGILGGVFLSIESISQDFDPNSTGTCTGTRSVPCSQISNNNTCELVFCDFELSPDHCEDEFFRTTKCESGSVDGDPAAAPLHNETTCGLLGCEWQAGGLAYDTFIMSKTDAAAQYAANSSEGIMRVECVGTNPRLFFLGFDFLSYRYWVLLVLIGMIVFVMVKLKRSH